MKVMFYVQHLLGIGHLVRASRIAHALKSAGHEIVMVSGGMPVDGFPGPGIDVRQLPALRAIDARFSGLATEDGEAASDGFLDRRRAALLDSLDVIRPDCVIIEAYPFARRQMRFELVPLLEAIAGMAQPERPMVVSSIRDVLQPKSAERDIATAALVRTSFDLVLVHGDATLATLDETFSQCDAIADLVAYTGMVGPEVNVGRADEVYDVVVSAGGGAVGAALLSTALDVCRSGALPELNWLFVTGENLDAAAFESLRDRLPDKARIARFKPHLAALLGTAKLSVSQAGYNTVADILRAGCASVLVPFSDGGEQEQALRASRLEALGHCVMLAQSALSRDTLLAAARRALAHSSTQPSASVLLDGAQQSAAILADRFAAFRPAQ